MQELGNFPILASLFAGILTFISPCILPLIPVYITLVTGLSVEELDSIAHAFEGESFEKISTTEIVKKLIKISPKALLKLGKFV